jgi:hypothetical protein
MREVEGVDLCGLIDKTGKAVNPQAKRYQPTLRYRQIIESGDQPIGEVIG